MANKKFYIKQKIAAYAAILISIFSVASNYTITLSAKEISEIAATVSLRENIDRALPKNLGYITADDKFLDNEFANSKSIREKCNDYCIVYSSSQENIDEVGVFLATENLSSLESEIKLYIENKKIQLSNNLKIRNSKELSKLNQAKVTTIGNYVIYTILSKEKTNTVLSIAKHAIESFA